jgi:hypothetical protein
MAIITQVTAAPFPFAVRPILQHEKSPAVTGRALALGWGSNRHLLVSEGSDVGG